MKRLIAVAALGLATLLCTSSGRAQTAYEVNGGACDVIQYPYVTYALCDDMADNAPSITNVSVNLTVKPDGTLDPASTISFCTGVTPTNPYCQYVAETLTGTALKGTDSTGAPTISVQAIFSGQFNGSIAYTITRHKNRLNRFYWLAGPGALTLS